MFMLIHFAHCNEELMLQRRVT